MRFANQLADNAGHLAVTIQSSGVTSPGIVNGLQIAAVPEPSTLLLLAVGGLSLSALGAVRDWKKTAAGVQRMNFDPMPTIRFETCTLSNSVRCVY